MKKYDFCESNRVLLNSLVKGWILSGADFEKSNYTSHKITGEIIITIKARTGEMLIINIIDAKDISFQIER